MNTKCVKDQRENMAYKGKGGNTTLVLGDQTGSIQLSQRNLRSRSASQPQNSNSYGVEEGIMGNSQSTQNPNIQSPQLMRPLPQFALETMMKVPRLPPLQEMLYGEKVEEQEEKQGVKQVQMGELEETEEIPIKSVVNMNDFIQVEGDEKLNLLMMAINKINTTFQYRMDKVVAVLADEEDGVFPRLRDAERDIDEFRTRIGDLEEDNKMLKSDVTILKGMVTVQAKQMNALQDAVVELKMRSMNSNVIIDGILGDVDEEEVCKEQALTFLRSQMEMQVEDKEVVKAHRLGEKKDGKARPMVIRCKEKLRARMFQYTKNLKGKTNANSKGYNVDPQLPEKMAAEKKELNSNIGRIKEKNKQLADGQKIKYQVRKKQLVVNNEIQKKKVIPPTHEDLFDLNMEEREQLEKIEMTDEILMEEKGNIFQARAKNIRTLEDARKGYIKMKILYQKKRWRRSDTHCEQCGKNQVVGWLNRGQQWFCGNIMKYIGFMNPRMEH